MKISLLLTCAGKGTRANMQKNKLLYKFQGSTIIEKTLFAFAKTGLIDEFIITASKEDFNYIRSLFSEEIIVVEGGDSRTKSVKNGLDAVSGDLVLIHDGARPFVSKEVIEDCIKTAVKFGSSIPVIPCPNTLCKTEEGFIKDYLGKDDIYQIQTPQGFITKDIVKAYSNIGNKSFNDDGEVYKTFVGEVHTSKGDEKNIKLTYEKDFENLNAIDDYRIGTGFDCHRLIENRELILGGIKIPHSLGLLGHSDADVLTHAIMDAMLSSVSQRDIGYHFPDSDEKYKGACSTALLKQVIEICKDCGYKIKSLSAVIMAEKPKLLKHIPSIAENLSSILNVNLNCVGITATTLEGLGFVGREEGICVSASVIMQKI